MKYGYRLSVYSYQFFAFEQFINLSPITKNHTFVTYSLV